MTTKTYNYDYRHKYNQPAQHQHQSQIPREEKLFWTVQDVMAELDISRPTAYKLMEQSGCLAPINRRKRVSKARFLAYLEGENVTANAKEPAHA